MFQEVLSVDRLIKALECIKAGRNNRDLLYLLKPSLLEAYGKYHTLFESVCRQNTNGFDTLTIVIHIYNVFEPSNLKRYSSKELLSYYTKEYLEPYRKIKLESLKSLLTLKLDSRGYYHDKYGFHTDEISYLYCLLGGSIRYDRPNTLGLESGAYYIDENNILFLNIASYRFRDALQDVERWVDLFTRGIEEGWAYNDEHLTTCDELGELVDSLKSLENIVQAYEWLSNYIDNSYTFADFLAEVKEAEKFVVV